MEKINSTITAGFSGNPGVYLGTKKLPGEKNALVQKFGELEGSTLTIAKFLQNFDLNPDVLIPVPVERNLDYVIFDFLLDQSCLQISRLPLIEGGPIAFIVNGKLAGEKGIVTNQESFLLDARRQVMRSTGNWRIATGITEGLVPFAELLLDEKNAGFRSLSPHHSLCDKKHILLPLLGRTDMFILNQHEYGFFSKVDLHKLGVKLLIVTNGEEGGYFSLCNETTQWKVEFGSFKAVKPKAKRLYFTGAGDCFNASIHLWIIKNSFSFNTITFEGAMEACNFASKVASIKVTMQGAANVPGPNEIIF